jgi:dTDP-4-dehydrorhamnose 3,5-epimerase
MMKFERLSLAGLVLITPQVFIDERGFFLESYNRREFAANGIGVDFVQANHSRSGKGILRGLHFQVSPFAQDKLVRVTRGKVFDVAVDLRPNSPTLGKYQAVELSAENKQMFFIPAGFAHGFLALSEVIDFQYQVSQFYQPQAERGIIWNDPDIGIDWPMATDLVVSDKDKKWPSLKEYLADGPITKGL